MSDRVTGKSADGSPLVRLSIALVLCIGLAVGCWVLAPQFGVYLPPIVPIMGFVVIAAGTLVSLWEAGKDSRESEQSDSIPFHRWNGRDDADP